MLDRGAQATAALTEDQRRAPAQGETLLGTLGGTHRDLRKRPHQSHAGMPSNPRDDAVRVAGVSAGGTLPET